MGRYSFEDVYINNKYGEVEECDGCNGSGIVRHMDTCPMCDGKGFIIKDTDSEQTANQLN